MEVVIILGSTKDEEHAKKISDGLTAANIANSTHVASAHREAKKLMEILEQYNDKKVIYVAIAGRSNALSGFIAGNTKKVTIACPPFSDKLDMLVNVHSTLQMPNNVPAMTILEPSNVVLAIQRIIELAS